MRRRHHHHQPVKISFQVHMPTLILHLNTVAAMRTVQGQFSAMSLSSAVVLMRYRQLALSLASGAEQVRELGWCLITRLCRSGK